MQVVQFAVLVLGQGTAVVLEELAGVFIDALYLEFELEEDEVAAYPDVKWVQ